MTVSTNPAEANIYTVSRLNNEARFILEDTFPYVFVEGEISNFSAPHSGHWYFCLKDAGAQVRCCLFKGHQRKLGFIPKDGAHVLIRAKVSLYENRGEFQLIAEHMEERGEGKLRKAYELLKKKLEAAGLFAAANKKALPPFPTCIGVVTSATGAAIKDILTVLKRRHPAIPVIIYASLVQGATAAPSIVNAIQIANRRKECDVLIVGRGGGSLEDLWPFNEEIVANAIYQSDIPIISAVGHEVDFTIADFVADLRAPTPSAAAELVAPDKADLLQRLMRSHQILNRFINQKLVNRKQQIGWVQKHLFQQHPKRRLQEKMQRLDFCELSLVQSQQRLIQHRAATLQALEGKLQQQLPIHRITKLENQLNLLRQRLNNAIAIKLANLETRLANTAVKLDTLSPLATLQRGFSIVSKNGQIVRSSKEVVQGERVKIQLFDGLLHCIVD